MRCWARSWPRRSRPSTDGGAAPTPSCLCACPVLTQPTEGLATTLPSPTGPLFVSALRNISGRRAQERQQRDFLAMIAHDLKTPITAIRASAQLMQRQERYDAQRLGIIGDQTRYLGRLIDDLAALSALEFGQLALRREPVELLELVERMVAQAAVLSTRHPITVAAPDGPIIGRWDRDRLVQVLHNLVGNAIKYSPAGGEITIQIERHPATVDIAVRDQGLGIPTEELGRVFTRFYRAKAARSTGITGSGLGLTICKGLVEAHGGTIRVASEPGRGSTFTVTLPLEP